jgi:hypothetical protein
MTHGGFANLFQELLRNGHGIGFPESERTMLFEGGHAAEYLPIKYKMREAPLDRFLCLGTGCFDKTP